MSKSLLPTRRTALILADYQDYILDNFIDEKARDEVVRNAKLLLRQARANNVPVIFVKVAFRGGYPEISPNNMMFSQLKAGGLGMLGNPASDICADLKPQADEPVVVKHRVSAFLDTDLSMLLRALSIENIILAGVATSGVILTTTREAADLDYKIMIARDACGDKDADVHAFLMDRIFPIQAKVLSTKEVFAYLD